MESARKTLNQFSQLIGKMPVSQQLSIALVAILIVGGLVTLTMRDSKSNYAPLSFGKPFTTEEIINAEQTFRDAGLEKYRREGTMLYVPADEIALYHGALINGGTLPSGFGDALEKQLEGGMGVFESNRTTQQRKDIALAKFLQQTIEAIPTIDYASVAWARSKASRWPHNDSKVTATVTVRPKQGHTITPFQYRSFRSAVASMVADLKPSDVTILDLSTGLSPPAEDIDGDLTNGLMKRIRDFTQEYETKISQALSYIPDVLVTVNVDVDELKSRVERTQKIDTKGSFKVYESTASRTEEVENRAPRSEPGVRNNQPTSLQAAAGPTETRSINQEDGTSTSAPSYTISEQEFFAAMPKAVQVSIKIPQSYYKAVAERSGVEQPESADSDDTYQRAIQDIEKRELDKIKATAAVLIPKGSDPSSIDVSSYHSVRETNPVEELGLWQKILEVATNWAGKIALFAVACWGLWMVSKSMPNVPQESEPEEPEEVEEEEDAPDQPKEPLVRKETTTRDALQSVVRDNPDITAGILEEWLHGLKQ